MNLGRSRPFVLLHGLNLDCAARGMMLTSGPSICIKRTVISHVKVTGEKYYLILKVK